MGSNPAGRAKFICFTLIESSMTSSPACTSYAGARADQHATGMLMKHRSRPAGRAKHKSPLYVGIYVWSVRTDIRTHDNQSNRVRQNRLGEAHAPNGIAMDANPGALGEIWKIELRTDYEPSDATPYRHASLIEASHFSVTVLVQPWPEVCI